jgi:hypothetical protein
LWQDEEEEDEDDGDEDDEDEDDEDKDDEEEEEEEKEEEEEEKDAIRTSGLMGRLSCPSPPLALSAGSFVRPRRANPKRSAVGSRGSQHGVPGKAVVARQQVTIPRIGR